MTDEDALRKDVNKADRARALLEDPVLTEAFDKLRLQYLQAIEDSAPTDSDQREKLFIAMRTLPAVKKHLESMLFNGSVAARQLANLEDDKARAKRKG